ncbi:MAG: DUF4258 domain-containing protein [Aquificales bacterium]|nr:DUF4258 domain-containing protein [Aquificales bacterium]
MNLIDKQAFIQKKAAENQQTTNATTVLWSRHAITEAVKDNLSRRDVEGVLLFAEVIEDYPPLRRPLPDCLVLGFLQEHKPVHAVIAVDEPNDCIFIITVYLPAKEKWENDWQTRK